MARKSPKAEVRPRHRRAAYLKQVVPRIAGAPAPAGGHPADRAVSALAHAAQSMQQLRGSTDDNLVRLLVDRALNDLAGITDDLRFVQESA